MEQEPHGKTEDVQTTYNIQFGVLYIDSELMKLFQENFFFFDLI